MSCRAPPRTTGRTDLSDRTVSYNNTCAGYVSILKERSATLRGLD